VSGADKYISYEIYTEAVKPTLYRKGRNQTNTVISLTKNTMEDNKYIV
jgi:hypothetical protein